MKAERVVGHVGESGGRLRVLANLVGTTLPVAGLIVAIVLLWGHLVEIQALVTLFGGYLLAGLGIAVGFHRLFTHRSFETTPAVR